MKRIIMLLAGLLIALSVNSAFADCVATVSPDLKVHIPAVQYDTGLYSVDLQYAPSNDGIIWFDFVGAGPADTLECDKAAFLFPASGAYGLYVPSLELGTDRYWLNLVYTPETAGAQARTAAGSPAVRLRVANYNREGIAEPQKTRRVPTKMMFGSTLKYSPRDWQPGDYTITMKSDLLDLVEDPDLASLTGALVFKEASGFLYADGSCKTILAGASCKIAGMGIGLFTIESLTIEDPDSSSPRIKMEYSMKFSPDQLRILYYAPTELGGDSDFDISENILSWFYTELHWSEADFTTEANRFEASGWNLLPGLGLPCNGCGWPYAEKVYPHREIQTLDSSEIFLTEIRTHMVLYE